MPPKPKEVVKKPPPTVIRPVISDSSLLNVPLDAVEGYQERIETGVDWTLVEQAARHHKDLCRRDEIPTVTFSEALQNKIYKSILSGFLDERSTLTLQEQWETILPMLVWDVEKFSNEEGKICFRNDNFITDDMVKLIKKAVKRGDRNVLKLELKKVDVLRINDCEMTELDEGLCEFTKVVNLNMCGNFLAQFDTTFIPSGIRSVELQANRISKLDQFDQLPSHLLYLGLARNFINDESVSSMTLTRHITVLDLSDNDIYNLEPLLDVLARLPDLKALSLAGNPCAVCACYARNTLMRLPRLKWLDARKILVTDRSVDPFEPHPDDLRSAYFSFTVIRIMSVPQPPKPDKGAVTTFHVELELPLLDSARRSFLMYRRHESLTEMLPPPEDEDWSIPKLMSTVVESKSGVGEESQQSDIYNHLVAKNSREICHFTKFESNKIQWNKIMNFQEPTLKIFCPDIFALRDTFRTVVTCRLVYTVTITGKPQKSDKKSAVSLKTATEQRVVLATVKCALKRPDWSQPAQYFHWDDSLGTNEALHWGDGDLSVLQYTITPIKVTKGKSETDTGPARQYPPDNLTCHFAFGIDTLRA